MNPKMPKLILNTLLTAMGALGTVYCVTTAFGVTVSPFGVFIPVLIASMYFSGCFVYKKFLYGLIPLTFGLLGLIFLTDFSSPVGPTLTQLTHDILTRFSSAYSNISFAIPAAPEGDFTLNYTLLFAVLGMLMSLWMAWGVGYRSCLITVAGSLPFLLLCVIINDTPPHVVPLIMLLAVWVTSLLNRERPGEPPTMDATRVGLILFAVLLFLGTAGFIYPKSDTADHQLPELVENMLDHLPEPLQQLLDRNSTGIKQEELGADTSRTLDLTEQGTRDRKDTVMMQLSTTQVGPLYLRGAAKDIYTGSSWESSDTASVADAVYAHTSLGTAYGVYNQAAVHIKKIAEDSDVLFTPYGFISCPGAEEIMSDLRINIDEEDYIAYYWPDVRSLDIENANGYPSDSYDEYVKSTCLSLPEDTKTALYDLAISYGYDPEMTTAETVAWVAQFIRSSGTYKLNVSRQPVNFDFAVYFLTESKEGYCVHFATAAAAMYRALGIPARYASGYRVTVPSEGIVVDVLDRDTHAWAEVYLSGLGWIPVETTPGFGETSLLPQVTHPEKMEEEEEPEPSEEPAEPEPSAATPSPSPSEEPVTPSQEPASPSPSAVTGVSSPQGGEAVSSGISVLPIAVGVLAIILTALLVLLIRRSIILSRRKKHFHQSGTNQAVLYQWQYVEHLTKWGAQPDKHLETLALKAKFSPHTITQEELVPYTAAVQQLSATTEQALSTGKRLRFKWLSCLEYR